MKDSKCCDGWSLMFGAIFDCWQRLLPLVKFCGNKSLEGNNKVPRGGIKTPNKQNPNSLESQTCRGLHANFVNMSRHMLTTAVEKLITSEI